MGKLDIIFCQFLLVSVSGGISVMGVFMVRELFKNYSTKKTFYYLWLLSFFFFLTPLPNISNFHKNLNRNKIYSMETEDTSTGAVKLKDILIKEESEKVNSLKESQKEEAQLLEQVIQEKGWKEENDLETEKKEYDFLSILRKIEIVWLIGVISIFSYYLLQEFRFRGNLKKGRLKEAERYYHLQIVEALSKQQEKLKLKTLPQVYYHTQISSPFLIGIWKPKIYFPIDIPKEDMSIILQHELIHYKRKDLWYQAMGRGIAFLHWFHPLAWLMLIKLEEDCEYSCDEEIVCQMEEEERKKYSKAILMTIYRARNQQGTGKMAFSEKNHLQKKG